MSRLEIALLLGLAALFAFDSRTERRLRAELEAERAFTNAVAFEVESMMPKGDPKWTAKASSTPP